MMADSPFVNPDPDRVFYQSDLVIGLWDGFPVSPGHALIVPRRVVATWFEATREEQIAILDGVEAAKSAIEERLAPNGYNIGINVGAAGGQTIFHLHVHVIPRFNGDVEDPRGGVRCVVPSKANYLKEPDTTREMFSPTSGSIITSNLLPELSRDLDSAQEVNFAVAFLLKSGWRHIAERLWDLLVQREGRATILTGDYLDVTDPDALQWLLDLAQNPDVKGRLRAFVFEATRSKTSFHPKAYLFVSAHGAEAAYVGSSNLSQPALTTGVEWNYRLAEVPNDVASAFRNLLLHPATVELTQTWLDKYRERRRPPANPQPVEAVTEPPPPPSSPHPIQAEALFQLERTREAGNGAGLVVLATGLGKTWLAAFDSAKFSRVLFVAHREEILSQAHRTFRTIRPDARLGYFTGKEKNRRADVLFASIQTLANHYRDFARDAFDYLVVDEFHHAAAASYRKVIDYFTPQFLLAITATPERTDGGDLLGLVGENVVYRCDLAAGIRQELLCPMRYHGVPDIIDYAQIPWRNRKFDIDALTAAVATQARAQNAFEQYEKLGGDRTVAFCVSQRHADFMAEFFRSRGQRAVAVHTGPESAHRSESLEQLAEGDLDIIFSVDVFNEGLDLPQVDTVMMLRPTESRVLWLQQLGRGLRKAPGKDHLVVIDYIGNHRTFLVKLQTLFLEIAGCLRVGSDAELKAALDQLERGELNLPPGCEVTYDLETLDILAKMLKTAKAEALSLWLEDFRTRHGRRPTASEAFHEGYDPRAVNKEYGSWLDFLKLKGALEEQEAEALEAHRQFLVHVGTTSMVKSYKMVLLQAMLSRVDISQPIGIDELTEAFIERARRSRLVAADLSVGLDNAQAVRKLLEKNPITAWTGGYSLASASNYFTYSDELFRSTLPAGEHSSSLTALTRELVDWRLADYLDKPVVKDGSFLVKLGHRGGRPVLVLDRKQNLETPTGSQTVTADDDTLTIEFDGEELTSAFKLNETTNVLQSTLRGWFGPDAGQPGTLHQVQFTKTESGWSMIPLGSAVDQKLVVGHRYAREQIPRFFGMKFSKATWNSGVVHEGNTIILLVTIEKGQLLPGHQYEDRFLSPELFQWQSQNRTTQASKFGQLLRDHKQQGVAVHLFIRDVKKTSGVSQPFLYHGEVEFDTWTGDNPVTITWKVHTGLNGSPE